MLNLFKKSLKLNSDGTIPKPVMLKGLHSRQTTFVLVSGFIVAGSCMWLYYLTVKNKKEKYRQFYKNLDQEEAFERMRKTGFLTCSDNFNDYK